MSESKTTAEIVKCEKHGLRYNAAKDWGCVRCRKEAGESIGQPRPAAATSPSKAQPAGAAPTAKSPPMGAALGLTAILLLAASGGLYFGHSVAYEAFQELTEQNRQEEQQLYGVSDAYLDELGLSEEDNYDDSYEDDYE